VAFSLLSFDKEHDTNAAYKNDFLLIVNIKII
jgi:hypothetical protein